MGVDTPMEKRFFRLPSLKSKREVLEIVACLLILFGSLGPWLWRGYNSYQVFNPETGERELNYEYISKISPFYLSVTYENENPTYEWLVSPGTSVAGLLLIAPSLVFLFTSSWRIKNITLAIALMGCFFFFLSLGGGLWLGLVTRFSWGFQAAVIGLTLMVGSVTSELFL